MSHLSVTDHEAGPGLGKLRDVNQAFHFVLHILQTSVRLSVQEDFLHSLRVADLHCCMCLEKYALIALISSRE